MRILIPTGTAAPSSPLSTTTLLLAFLLSFFPYYASAWSFSISSRVVQCANLSVTWDGGVPPWNIVLIPVGALASGPEIRTIVDANVTSGNSYAFQLKFPTNSSFLAMMSDATGIGTGGTSVLITVLDGDSSCLATSATKPLFYFYLDPATGNPNQCGTWGVSWDSGSTQGPVRMAAMIPGGQTFSLPVPSSGASFDWTVDMRQNTEFLLVAGDSRGFGTGGSTNLYTVQGGSGSCIDAATPSSTAAPAAGGIYATGSGGGTVTGSPGDGPQATGSSGSSSGGKTNVGAIVGGTIAGVAAIIIIGLLILFFYRRRRLHKQGAPSRGRRSHSVDLLNDSGGAANGHALAAGAGAAGTAGVVAAADRPGRTSGGTMSQANDDQPSVSGRTDGTGAPIWAQYRRSDAPSLPVLNFAGSEDDHSVSTHLNQAPSSRGANNFPPSAFPAGAAAPRPETPSATETSVRTPNTRRNSKQALAGGPQLRPVNIVQHDDAGALPAPGGSAVVDGEEVLELPPTYQEVRRNSLGAAGEEARS